MKTFYEIMEEKDLNNLTPLEYAIWFLESATGASGAQQAASELAALISESQSRQRALVEKSDELTTEWKRAEMAEAQLARITAELDAYKIEGRQMKKVYIELTEEQKHKLIPLHDALMKSNARGKPSMILAQVLFVDWNVVAVVGEVKYDKAIKLQAALGDTKKKMMTGKMALRRLAKARA